MSKQSIIIEAEKFCVEGGHRLTDPRRHVLEIIAKAKKPIGAYDVLSALGKFLDNPKPPTAYRAIDFWHEHGFIHKIESLNAYVMCHAGHHHEGSQFLICDDCGDVTETHLCHLPDRLQAKAVDEKFTVQRWNVELHGRCGDCSQNV